MSLSPEELKARTQRFFEEGWNKHNPAEVLQHTAPDYIDNSTQPPTPGPEGFRQAMESTLAAFPDIHFTIEDLIVEGDKVVIRWSATGTHKRAWLGVPPTGKVLTVTGISINRMNGEGKVVEDWYNIDFLSMLQQMGAITTPNQVQAPAYGGPRCQDTN